MGKMCDNLCDDDKFRFPPKAGYDTGIAEKVKAHSETTRSGIRYSGILARSGMVRRNGRINWLKHDA